LQPGDKIVHPTLGKGEVVFDKPHCLGIKFILHGRVNFTQEAWTAQTTKAPQGVPEIEYKLADLVEDVTMTEQEALGVWDRNCSRGSRGEG
jgi:hypothetical protein